MFKKFKILVAFLFSVFTSCNVGSTKNSHFQSFVTDTSFTHRPNEIDFSREMNSLLNLPTIYNGVESFELRIWITSMKIRKELIVLKLNQGKWSALEYGYYRNSDTIDSMSVYAIPTPKEIDKIVAYLTHEELLNLPSQVAIPDFTDRIDDGQTFTIEISTNNFYKALQYHSPEYYSHEPNNIKFMALIKFLNSYFSFYNP